MKRLFLLPAISVVLFSCQDNRVEDSARRQALKVQGDSITTLAQQTLVKNLTAAIQKGGYEYAVDFCNVEAASLTSSAVQYINASIQRISDRNRNPGNALKTQTDRDVFEHFRKFSNVKDTLALEDNKYVYYKRINLAMPTCMNCHGAPQNIEPAALARIDAHYPGDKAKNYNLNEFRGLWKLAYENE